MAQALKYYKGEASNPYEETNEKQGLWCQRYNAVASMLWDFEYHWANGWDKYSKLVGRNPSYYFELHKQPQKEFSNIQQALQAFSMQAYSGLLANGSARWLQYVYDHAMQERFYKPVYNVVPADEVPAYLHWYKGEAQNPFQHEPASSTKGFWWDFEANWYKRADKLGKQEWEQYLHDWFVNRVWGKSQPLTKQQLQEFEKAYKAGIKRVWL